MIENLSQSTPAQIDGEIARVQDVITGLRQQAHRLEQTKRRSLEQAEAGRPWMSQATIEEMGAEYARLTERIDKIYAEIKTVRNNELHPLTDEDDRRGGWTRYYLVDNDTGHVHSSTYCSTCRPTTSFYWLTEQSGLTHAELVALAGEKACTVCFPNAPVAALASTSHLEGPNQKATREERERRAAAQAGKAAQTAAKAITMPDGSPLRPTWPTTGGRWANGEPIKTEVAASRRAIQDAYDLRWYGPQHPHAPEWKATVERCLTALAHKRGTTVEDERAALDKKVEAKYRRETT